MDTVLCSRPSSFPAGGYVLPPGTLYGALNSLCEKGWIRQLPVERGSRKKEYQLTAEGLAVLKHELARLQQLVANGESIRRRNDHEHAQNHHKVYLAWDFKKEELWLNEMAAEGWALEHAAFCSYTFVRCEPGEYIIRMEMNADRDYRSFVEETGAEYVGGCVNWIYFRRKAELGRLTCFRT